MMNELPLIVTPDEDEAGAASIFVDGTLGSRPYRWLLDTGAARTSVIADDYTSTFSSVGDHDSSGVFAQSSSDLITVPSLTVGSISKINITVVRERDPNPALRSLIGMDLLKDYRCHFRFDDKRLSLDAPIDGDYPFQPLFLDGKFHPYVDVRLGAGTVKAVWDTGASMTVVDMHVIQQYPACFQEVGKSTGTDATGAQVETPMFSLAQTIIGGHAFPPHKVAGVDLSYVNATLAVPMDLILGYTTLSQANWLFDFPQQRWAISKWLGIAHD